MKHEEMLEALKQADREMKWAYVEYDDVATRTHTAVLYLLDIVTALVEHTYTSPPESSLNSPSEKARNPPQG